MTETGSGRADGVGGTTEGVRATLALALILPGAVFLGLPRGFFAGGSGSTSGSSSFSVTSVAISEATSTYSGTVFLGLPRLLAGTGAGTEAGESKSIIEAVSEPMSEGTTVMPLREGRTLAVAPRMICSQGKVITMRLGLRVKGKRRRRPGRNRGRRKEMTYIGLRAYIHLEQLEQIRLFGTGRKCYIMLEQNGADDQQRYISWCLLSFTAG